MPNIARIQNSIDQLNLLISEVENLSSNVSSFLVDYSLISGCTLGGDNSIEKRIRTWKAVTTEVLTQEMGGDDPNLISFNCHWQKADGEDALGYTLKEKLIQKLKNAKNDLVILQTVANERNAKISAVMNDPKPPKIFISHKEEDKQYANALVCLINFIIGSDGEKIFCSSVPGYCIKQSQDILDALKEQFCNFKIFMVIIHSPRYYKSSICLNEMGASWALGTKFASFMTKDCNYDMLNGVIGKEKICININDETSMLNAHLNDFKDDLLSFFGAKSIAENKWENERKRFVDSVLSLSYTPEAIESDTLFDTIYVPAVDTIFSLLDMDHFSRWAYLGAIDGNTIIVKPVYQAIGKVISYIKSRPKYKQYASLDSLFRNLGLLLSDFRDVLSYHTVEYGDDVYIVERFYKNGPNGESFNPYYDEFRTAYDEYTRLISDLLFELARLCNLILSRVREARPNYKQDLGILFIDDRIDEPDLVYREDEISDSPYPGIERFIAVRLTRDKHFGTSATINMDGFEKGYLQSLLDNC